MRKTPTIYKIALAIAIASSLALVLASSGLAKEPMLIDDFESAKITNLLGGKTNVYVKAPSKAMISFRNDSRVEMPTTVLMVRYDKRNEGGPYDMGGWCGYYTLLKKAHPSVQFKEDSSPAGLEEEVYFDGEGYKSITMWVKGEKGTENFMVGLADAHWDKVGDSVKSEAVGKYLPAGKITTGWQKMVIPVEEYFVDYTKLSSISICFESDCFPEGMGAGTIFIDDITLE